MTKHLRLIMLSLLAMICLGGYSQSEVIIWQEDWTGAKAGQKVNKINTNYSAQNDGTTIYNENRAGGVAPELLLKKSDTFVVTIEDLKGCSGELTLTYKSNNKNIASIKANDKPVTFTLNGKDRTAKITINEGTTSLKLEFSCKDNNTRLDNFKLVGNAAGESQKKTSLSFPGEGVNLFKGKLDDGKDFNGYTAKEANDVPGTITYAASGDGVATVDVNTGVVKVDPNVYGKTTITATFTPTETETYVGSTASYTITNKEPERTPTAITFGAEVDNNTFEVKDGDTFVGRVAKCTTEGATGSIEYKSSDEAIAKVDATTGVITLGAKYGTAVITATFVATGSFANSEASYSIKHVEDFVFYESFDKCDGNGGNDNKWSGNLLGKVLTAQRADNSGWNFVNGRERNQCASFGSKDNIGSATSPDIPIDQKAQLKFKAACWDTNAEDSQITISVSKGTLTYNGKNSQSVTIDMVKGAWTDYSMIVSGTKSFTVTFAGSGTQNRFFLDEVMVTKVAPQEITLDENSDNIVEAADNVNVTLKRTFFHDNAWNTLCLPFDVDANEVATAFAGAEIREIDLSQCKDNTIQFVPATEIKAGVPYIIKWNENVAEAKPFEKTFEGVTLVAEPKPVKVNNDITFTGFYNKTTADKLGTSVAAVGAGSKLFKVVGEGEMKGFRAAFVLNPTAQLSAFNVVIDGVTNGIEDLVIDGVKANGRVYNLNGQYVGNSLNGLQPGLYIQNGKKIVVK